MNSLVKLYGAYLSQKNIYDEVKNFQKQEQDSPNFCQVMEWLQESMELLKHERIDEIETVLNLKTKNERLTLKAEMKDKSCLMTQMKNQECM